MTNNLNLIKRVFTDFLLYASIGLMVLPNCRTKDKDENNTQSQVGVSEVKEVACNCPMLSKSSVVFNFKNDQKVIACSSSDSSYTDSIFSSAKLIHCNSSRRLNFENVNSNGKIYGEGDTMIIHWIHFSDSINHSLSFTKEKVFFINDSLQTYIESTEAIGEMSEEEIQKVVSHYKKSRSLYPESAMALAKGMLVAALNGNKEMGQGLIDYENKMGRMSGSYGRQLKEYKEMYRIYLGGKD